MSPEFSRRLMVRLAKATLEDRKRIIAAMTPHDLLILDAHFESWAQKGQLPPLGEGWRVWLMLAGRGFGKTRAGAEWIHGLASGRKKLRIALVAASIAEARSIMVEGVSGILSVAGRNQRRVSWEPSLNRLRWRGGSEAKLFSGDSPDGLRGAEHDFAWFLTFEIEADAAPPALGALLADASDGLIASDSAALVDGYAAYGSSIKAAVEPLVRHFGLELFDDGVNLRPATPAAALILAEDDLGNSAGAGRAERIERAQTAARALPVTLTMAYYEASRDYQTAQVRASIGEAGGAHESSQLAAVIGADAARALVEAELARRWARRDQLTLRLPPRCIVLEPGSAIELAATPARWTVEQCVIEALVAVVKLRPQWSSVAAIAADPGRALPSPDIVQGETSLALFDLPDLGVEDSSRLALHLASASPSSGWKAVAVEIEAGGASSGGQTAARESVLGQALAALPPGQPHLLDLGHSIEVELVDPNHWLESCDDQALAMGANLAVLGSELIQFGQAQPNGPGRFVLSRLVRGRRGTEWAMAGHSGGEAFNLLAPGTVQRIAVAASLRGSPVEVRSVRLEDSAALPVSAIAAGEAQRPPSPVHAQASQAPTGEIAATWVRRSRDGWAWLDEMDAPLGEARELYRVSLAGSAATIEVETEIPSVLLSAAQAAQAGPGGATLSIRQLGDVAASRAAILPITLV